MCGKIAYLATLRHKVTIKTNTTKAKRKFFYIKSQEKRKKNKLPQRKVRANLYLFVSFFTTSAQKL